MIVTEKHENKISQLTETVFVWDVGVPYRDVYMRLFWRPFLRNALFTLYDTLISFASVQTMNVDAVAFSVASLVAVQGGGSRSTLLGRSSSGSRPAQNGAVTELVGHEIIRHWTRGEGRQVIHEFEILPWLPILTPTQAQQLPKNLMRQHALFLGSLPHFKLTQWRQAVADSYVPAMVDCVGYTAVVMRR